MRSRIHAAFVLVGLTGCTRGSDPPLPVEFAARFEPAVRAVVEPAIQAAAAAPADPAKQKALGMLLHAHDQFAAAAGAYRRALAGGSPDKETAYYLGAVLAAEGKHGEAAQWLRKGGDSAAVRLALADSLRESGDAAAAREEYRKLLASDPSLAQAHFGLGRTLSGAEAELAFRKALDRFPRYGAAQFVLAAELRRTGRTPEAAKVLANYERDKLVAPAIADPAMDRIFLLNESSTGLIRRAQILDSEGHPAEALALHERVVRTAPKMEQAWINMISLYARGGQPGKAEDAYRKAIALAPARAEAHYNFGVFCFNSERWADAAKAFAKALELDPNHAAAAHNLGAVVERTGDLTRAAGLFRRAIANQPDHRLARFHLGRIYANRRQFDLAAAEFERIIQPLDDQSATYLYALGATYARAGRRDRAVAALEQARMHAQARGQQAIAQAVERDLATLWNNR